MSKPRSLVVVGNEHPIAGGNRTSLNKSVLRERVNRTITVLHQLMDGVVWSGVMPSSQIFRNIVIRSKHTLDTIDNCLVKFRTAPTPEVLRSFNALQDTVLADLVAVASGWCQHDMGPRSAGVFREIITPEIAGAAACSTIMHVCSSIKQDVSHGAASNIADFADRTLRLEPEIMHITTGPLMPHLFLAHIEYLNYEIEELGAGEAALDTARAIIHISSHFVNECLTAYVAKLLPPDCNAKLRKAMLDTTHLIEQRRAAASAAAGSGSATETPDTEPRQDSI